MKYEIKWGPEVEPFGPRQWSCEGLEFTYHHASTMDPLEMPGIIEISKGEERKRVALSYFFAIDAIADGIEGISEYSVDHWDMMESNA